MASDDLDAYSKAKDQAAKFVSAILLLVVLMRTQS
jgi:hypothetical protein